VSAPVLIAPNADPLAVATARMRAAKVAQLVEALRLDQLGITLPCFAPAIREYRQLDSAA
jgi:hypothetical protein